MERRLLLAKELLNPDDSVLIVTIDEKEYLRLGLLLEQVFPERRSRWSVGYQRGAARFRSVLPASEYIFSLSAWTHGSALGRTQRAG